uniref:hypothetical protein n=1 Tax=Cronobacter sakazakii TaxID=28141 RepID=UPI001F2053BF
RHRRNARLLPGLRRQPEKLVARILTEGFAYQGECVRHRRNARLLPGLRRQPEKLVARILTEGFAYQGE